MPTNVDATRTNVGCTLHQDVIMENGNDNNEHAKVASVFTADEILKQLVEGGVYLDGESKRWSSKSGHSGSL